MNRMRVAVLSADVLVDMGAPGISHADIAKRRTMLRDALLMAKSRHHWRVGGLASPDGDRLWGAVQAFAIERCFVFTTIPAADSPQLVDDLWKWTDALLVITDGTDYQCAELARRAAHRLGADKVFVHVVPWEQGSLWQ